MQVERPLHAFSKLVKHDKPPNIDEIANSLYSFTYTQCTGTLLHTRLRAIKDSLNDSTKLKVEDIEELIGLTRQWPNLDSNKLTDQQKHLLEVISYPYLDLIQNDQPLVRPPPMVRRATSLSVKKSDVQNLEILSDGHKFGVPTPLEHVPAKYSNFQAILTTKGKQPYSIQTANDITCLLLNESSITSKDMLGFVSQDCKQWLVSQIENNSAKVKIGGSIILINGKVVSLWVQSISNNLFVWVLEEIRADVLPNMCDFVPGDIDVSKCLFIPDYSAKTLTLYSKNLVCQPLSLGCSIAVSKDLHILSYNRSILNLMLGQMDINGSHVTVILPQFLEFWAFIEPYCSTPGTIIPEHNFRRLVGVKVDSNEYVSPNPSEDPHHSIHAINSNGENVYVDIQFRVVSTDFFMIWMSYSHTSFRDSRGASPQPDGIKKHKRDRTVSVTDLVKLKVGKKRKEKTISKFKILKLLGEGTYGKVQLVEYKSQHLALKSIYKDRILIDSWSRDRVLGTIPNEIKILNNLRLTPHPKIVEMVDFFEDNLCYYVEMLPLEHGPVLDLFDYIEYQKSQGKESDHYSLLLVWQQIVSAVAHIHSLGIVHRDLKDENVIINRNGDVKLIDFGSAAYINQGPFELFVGSVDYAAPEVLLGQAYTGKPQDCWALGVLLYTILFGEVPFRSAEDIIKINLPKDIRCLGSQIICKTLQSEPEERPSAAQVLVQLNQLI